MWRRDPRASILTEVPEHLYTRTTPILHLSSASRSEARAGALVCSHTCSEAALLVKTSTAGQNTQTRGPVPAEQHL